jgi:serine/threonine protein kinase
MLYMPGSCLDIMKTAYPEGFDEISIATILKQALQGLDYLHKNGHIHRQVGDEEMTKGVRMNEAVLFLHQGVSLSYLT